MNTPDTCTKTVEDHEGPFASITVTAQNNVIVTFSESVSQLTKNDVTIEIPNVDFTYEVSKISEMVYEIAI